MSARIAWDFAVPGYGLECIQYVTILSKFEIKRVRLAVAEQAWRGVHVRLCAACGIMCVHARMPSDVCSKSNRVPRIGLRGLPSEPGQPSP